VAVTVVKVDLATEGVVVAATVEGRQAADLAAAAA
jgi:hypothetical protein